MVRDLQLKGNELLVYALIYGFSQAENQVFNGSLQYIADWTNSTKRSVMTCLKSLVEKGLIGKNEKIINGVKFCEYYATDFTGVMKNFPYPMEKSSIGGMENSSPNNIGFNNLKDNIKNNIYSASPAEPTKPSAPQKHKYGEYKNVLLTDEEYEKLKDEFPNDYEERIERLSSYIASKGAKYKNHLATIRNWARKDREKVAEDEMATTNPFLEMLDEIRGGKR
jgi:hypothetical protein